MAVETWHITAFGQEMAIAQFPRFQAGDQHSVGLDWLIHSLSFAVLEYLLPFDSLFTGPNGRVVGEDSPHFGLGLTRVLDGRSITGRCAGW